MKKSEPVLMPIGSNGPQGSGMKRSTMGVKRSKVKVTRGQRSRSHEVKGQGHTRSKIDLEARRRGGRRHSQPCWVEWSFYFCGCRVPSKDECFYLTVFMLFIYSYLICLPSLYCGGCKS